MVPYGPIIAAILTVMIFSYILGDNFLFKLAAHIFVGVAAGYAIVVVWYEVFVPAFSSGNWSVVLPALILCILLIFKIRPRPAGTLPTMLGNIALAFVLGVGIALSVGGMLFGTLLPQTAAMMALSLNPSSSHYAGVEALNVVVMLISNLIIILGTIGTFFYFTFVVRADGLFGGLREGFVRFAAGMGRLMIILTLSTLFANALTSRVALLISRLQFLAGFFEK
jgi:hypothetical protein